MRKGDRSEGRLIKVNVLGAFEEKKDAAKTINCGGFTKKKLVFPHAGEQCQTKKEGGDRLKMIEGKKFDMGFSSKGGQFSTSYGMKIKRKEDGERHTKGMRNQGGEAPLRQGNLPARQKI